jgi:ribonuclease BN (tRNA processing enzyme)
MTDLRVRFLGTGDPFGSGGRLQSCVLIDGAEGRYLVDCGATAPFALSRYGIDPASLDGIIISHWHGDHAGGLPALILDLFLGTTHGAERRPRSRPLLIAGPVGTEARVCEAMRLNNWDVPLGPTAERPFNLVEHVALVPGTTVDVGAVSVLPCAVVHTPEALGFRLSVGGRSIAYSGDTAWTDALVEMSAGADLFICQVYSYAIELPTMLSYRRIVAERSRLTPRRLILTHLGAEMIAQRGQVSEDVAEDGLTVVMGDG